MFYVNLRIFFCDCINETNLNFNDVSGAYSDLENNSDAVIDIAAVSSLHEVSFVLIFYYRDY